VGHYLLLQQPELLEAALLEFLEAEGIPVGRP